MGSVFFNGNFAYSFMATNNLSFVSETGVLVVRKRSLEKLRSSEIQKTTSDYYNFACSIWLNDKLMFSVGGGSLFWLALYSGHVGEKSGGKRTMCCFSLKTLAQGSHPA